MLVHQLAEYAVREQTSKLPPEVWHHAKRAVIGRGLAQQFGRGHLHRQGIAEAQLHQPAFGLVRDGVAAELHDHGESEFTGGGSGF